MDDMVLHAEYDCSHDDSREHCLVVAQFKGVGGFLGFSYRETLGMKAQYSMRQARQIMTRAPVNKPPAWVFTPLAQLTAVLKFSGSSPDENQPNSPGEGSGGGHR